MQLDETWYKGFMQAYYDRRLMPQFIFLLKNLLHLYIVRFCNQLAS